VKKVTCEERPSTSVPVSSFANYRKSKGKEWKNKVSKSGDNKKKKIENVAIYVGLMEWCEKEQKLKGRRGKKYQYVSQ
jgi:hypothetical protein